MRLGRGGAENAPVRLQRGGPIVVFEVTAVEGSAVWKTPEAEGAWGGRARDRSERAGGRRPPCWTAMSCRWCPASPPL